MKLSSYFNKLQYIKYENQASYILDSTAAISSFGI